jgi:hypothetical protein
VEFEPSEVVQVAMPCLKAYALPICLTWNPLLSVVLPEVERAIKAPDQFLAGRAASRMARNDI